MLDETVRNLDLALSVAIGIGGLALGLRDGELLVALFGAFILYQTWELRRAQQRTKTWQERFETVTNSPDEEWQ